MLHAIWPQLWSCGCPYFHAALPHGTVSPGFHNWYSLNPKSSQFLRNLTQQAPKKERLIADGFFCCFIGKTWHSCFITLEGIFLGCKILNSHVQMEAVVSAAALRFD